MSSCFFILDFSAVLCRYFIHVNDTGALVLPPWLSLETTTPALLIVTICSLLVACSNQHDGINDYDNVFFPQSAGYRNASFARAGPEDAGRAVSPSILEDWDNSLELFNVALGFPNFNWTTEFRA